MSDVRYLKFLHTRPQMIQITVVTENLQCDLIFLFKDYRIELF